MSCENRIERATHKHVKRYKLLEAFTKWLVSESILEGNYGRCRREKKIILIRYIVVMCSIIFHNWIWSVHFAKRVLAAYCLIVVIHQSRYRGYPKINDRPRSFDGLTLSSKNGQKNRYKSGLWEGHVYQNLDFNVAPRATFRTAPCSS